MTTRRMAIHGGASALVAILLSATFARAALPTVVWQARGGAGVFSADGSSILLTTPTGFQIRRSADGVLQKTITLPVGSRSFTARAFSPDKQYVAITMRANGVTRVELWRVATGTLVRTINTDAGRTITSLDFSTTGLLASYERFASRGGGLVRVYRVSDGVRVARKGPYTRNSHTFLRFSPDGQYLAVQDLLWVNNGVSVLRTSDWRTAFTIGNHARPVQWSPNNSLWIDRDSSDETSLRRVLVPSGTVAQSVTYDASSAVTAVTPDNRFFLAWVPGGNTIQFLRTTDATTRLSYGAGRSGYSDTVNPAGTLFTYGNCPARGCVSYVARVPSL